ncbi:MAG: acyl carrier protein [Clostridia bacterium]|nr:acyl carrier protein [Clostridia bacterium]
MEDILEILRELKPGVALDENTELVNSRILDSLTMLRLVGKLSSEFEVVITARDVLPENFANARAIAALIDRLVARRDDED